MANNYYKNQLDKVVEQHLRKEDTMKVRISSSHGFTHWMDLNNESAKELILWLQNNFPDCMDEVVEETAIKEYKGYEIHAKVGSHSAIIYKDGEFIKAIAGDIAPDGSTNVIEKSKKWIDNKALQSGYSSDELTIEL